MPRTLAKIHPTIKAAVAEAAADMTGGVWATLDDERRRVLTHYSQMRQRRIWPVLLGSFVTSILGVLSIAMIPEISAETGFVLFCVFLVSLTLTVRAGRGMATSQEELKTIAPALRLTRIQRAYLDARLILETLGLPGETERELKEQLDGLVDEETRLRAALEGFGIRAVRPEEIEAEQTELRARLETATDPMSREALEYGLATSERRLAAARGLSLATQRIDAQLEMIAQSIGDVRDGLHRLRLLPGEADAGIDLAPIRQTLEHVQNHAAALEGAVAEVKALGGA